MKTKLKLVQARMFRMVCAVALGMGSSFSMAAAAADSADIAETSIPWSQIGAKAAADYRGDGLAVIPTAAGARLRCVFQRLEGEATRDGLWLTSTVTNAVNDRFRVVAASVGRSVIADASNALAPFTPMNIERPPGLGLRQSSGAFEVSAVAKRQRTAAVQEAIAPKQALPRRGTVSIDGQSVRFIRPGLVEEYTLSMDGVRQ